MSKRNPSKPPNQVTAAMLHRPRQWMLDTDYWQKLSPEEKAWKAQFDDEYYRGAARRYEKPLHGTPKLQRDTYSTHNANQRDVYSRSQAAGMLVGEADAPVVSVPPSTSHLQTAEYKSAVAEVLKLIDVRARHRTKHQRSRLVMLQRYIKSLVEAGEV